MEDIKPLPQSEELRHFGNDATDLLLELNDRFNTIQENFSNLTSSGPAQRTFNGGVNPVNPYSYVNPVVDVYEFLDPLYARLRTAAMQVREINIMPNAVGQNQLQIDSVVARHIVAGEITADKLNVNTLSAISGNIGTIVAGNITLDTSGFIRGGATSYNSGSGFWMGYNGGAYKLFIGNSAGNKLLWDGSTLSLSFTYTGTVDWSTQVTGTGKPADNADVTATHTAANITGQGALATLNTISWSGGVLTGRPTELTDGRITTAINSAGLVVSGIKAGITVSAGGLSGLYMGSDFMGYYNGTAWKTYLDNSGNFYLGGTSGNLQWNGTTLTINGGGTFSGALSAASGTFTGSLSGATGTFSGSLSAATGTFSGTITAVAGTIGGWTLATSSLKAGSGSNTVGLDSSGSFPVIYAGSATPGSAPFQVSSSGALTATNATITGTITATSGSFSGTITSTSGTIGGFTIGTSSLIGGTGTGTVGIDAVGYGGIYMGSNSVGSKQIAIYTGGTMDFYEGGSFLFSLTTSTGSTNNRSATLQLGRTVASVQSTTIIFTASNGNVSAAGTITAASFTGAGSGLTGIPGSSISGAISVTSISCSSVSSSGDITSSGNLAGNGLIGRAGVGGATGNAFNFQWTGSRVDLWVDFSNQGHVLFAGTYTASALSNVGYVTMYDSSGTSRRFAIV